MIPAKCIIHRGPNQVEVGATAVRKPGPGEVIIETALTCISPGTELRCLSGAGSQRGMSPFPFIPGYALAGTVTETGPGAALAPGSRVICGGTRHAEGFTLQWGGHVSHAVHAAEGLIPIPAGVSFETALIARLTSISYHGTRLSQPRPGERAAAVGLGVIGMAAAKFHAVLGCDLLALDRSEVRVNLAREWGLEAMTVTESINATVRGRFPKGVDILIDSTGAPPVAPDAVRALRDLPWDDSPSTPARYLVQGSYSGDVAFPYEPTFFAEAQVLFPRNWKTQDFRDVMDLVLQDELDLSPLISDIRPPEAAPQTYAELRNPDTRLMTVMFRWM